MGGLIVGIIMGVGVAWFRFKVDMLSLLVGWVSSVINIRLSWCSLYDAFCSSLSVGHRFPHVSAGMVSWSSVFGRYLWVLSFGSWVFGVVGWVSLQSVFCGCMLFSVVFKLPCLSWADMVLLVGGCDWIGSGGFNLFLMYLHDESLKINACLRLGVLSQSLWVLSIPFRKFLLGSLRVSCPFTSDSLSYFVVIYMIINYTMKLGVLSLYSWWALYISISGSMYPVYVAKGLVEGRALISSFCSRNVLGCYTTVFRARSPSCRRFLSTRGKLFQFASPLFLLRLLGVSTTCYCRSVSQVVLWPLEVSRYAEEFEDDARAQSAVIHHYIPFNRSCLCSSVFYIFMYAVLVCKYGLECRTPRQ